MKKIFALLFAFSLLLFPTVNVLAANGTVTYSGNAGSFIFEPGSEHSPTDLFPDFKKVMPGDTLTQRITVKNNADNKVDVKIYIRSLGAHEDSVDFLSQLNLTVAPSNENEASYMFDAATNQASSLTGWVYLGTLHSGAEIDLDITLSVPVELTNEYQNEIGYIDWEFMVDEIPIDSSSSQEAQAKNIFKMKLFFAITLCSLITMITGLIFYKTRTKQPKH